MGLGSDGTRNPGSAIGHTDSAIGPGLEVIKLEFILKLKFYNLKINRNDWLLADTCLQAANHSALF